MKIEVRLRGLESFQIVRDHAARRVLFHLSRFGKEVTLVLVRISDINGPKGGIDTRCQVTVRGPRFGSTTLHDLSGDAYSAIDMAVERIGRQVGREIDRVRNTKRVGPSLRSAS